MIRRANYKRKVFIITVAFATIGCTTFSLKDGSAVAQEPVQLFDPLSLPKRDLVPNEPWLDPMVFNSEKAYNIRARLDDPTVAAATTTDATYVGGSEQMISYIKETILSKMAKDCGWLKPPTLYFTVNEQGRMENVELIETSGNEAVDKILMGVIRDMPKWNPALNAEGVMVKQVFEFNMVQAGC